MGPTAKTNDYDLDFEGILKKFYEMQKKRDDDYEVMAIRKEEELERLKSELEWIRIREYELREKNLRDSLSDHFDVKYDDIFNFKYKYSTDDELKFPSYNDVWSTSTITKPTCKPKKENLLPDDLFEVK